MIDRDFFDIDIPLDGPDPDTDDDEGTWPAEDEPAAADEGRQDPDDDETWP